MVEVKKVPESGNYVVYIDYDIYGVFADMRFHSRLTQSGLAYDIASNNRSNGHYENVTEYEEIKVLKVVMYELNRVNCVLRNK